MLFGAYVACRQSHLDRDHMLNLLNRKSQQVNLPNNELNGLSPGVKIHFVNELEHFVYILCSRIQR